MDSVASHWQAEITQILHPYMIAECVIQKPWPLIS